MRTIVFLKNNPNVVEDALEKSSPPVDRTKIAMYGKKKRAMGISLFLSSIVLNICDLYLLNIWKIRGRRMVNIKENNRGKYYINMEY